MEVDHKDLIDKNYMLFTELLRLKSIPLIRYLYDEQILTEKDASKTMSQAAHTLRAMHLLDNMLKLGSEAFESLYAAILYTKLWRAADLLEPRKRPHQAIDEEPKIELPEKWPDAAYFKEMEYKELEIKEVDKKDDRMIEWFEQSKKNNIYDMRAKVKGRALIINNYKFAYQKLREGSEKDVERLKSIFKGLCFEPDFQGDLKAKEMIELLQKECKRDHSDYSCFFLIIMSHGHKGVVYGTDGFKDGDDFHNSLYIEDIKKQFTKVKSLEKKPKVFIIQACQGAGKDRGVKQKKVPDEEEADEDEDLEPFVHADSGEPADDGTGADGGNQADNDGNEEADNEGNMPISENDSDSDSDEGEEGDQQKDADDNTDGLTAEAPFHFLVALATTEGNLSYRNPEYGTWFIQAFIFVLSTYAWKEDLLTLMEKVNELVRKGETPMTRDKRTYKQVSQITNTFIKKFFFFPGLTQKDPKKKGRHPKAFDDLLPSPDLQRL